MSEEHEEHDDEVSPGGSRIYRHEARVPSQPAGKVSGHLEVVSDHVERHLGPISGVWHELVSDLVPVDLLVVEPTDARPCFTIVTSGMSDAPMRVPTELGDSLGYSELCVSLPPKWPLTQEAFADEAHYWPLRLLKTLARLPHAYDTWLGPGHTIPNGDPAAPYSPDCPFVCGLLLPPITAPREFWTLELTEQKSIDFLGVYPLTAAETDLKLREGADALLARFEKHGVTDVVDLLRPDLA